MKGVWKKSRRAGWAAAMAWVLIASSVFLPAVEAQDSSVQGTLIDEDGAALSGATVRLIPRHSGFEWSQLGSKLATNAEAAWDEFAVSGVRTDIDGFYRVAVPEVGPWTSVFSSPGRASVWTELAVSGGVQELAPFRLVKAVPFAVSVVDERGQPVKSALVYIDLEFAVNDFVWSDLAPVAAWTDSRGVATVKAALSQGRVDVFARGFVAAQGGSVNFSDPSASLVETGGKEIVLRSGVEREITVAVDGTPVGGVAIIEPDGILPIGSTDELGRVTLTLAKNRGDTDGWALVAELEAPSAHHHLFVDRDSPEAEGTVEGKAAEKPTASVTLTSQIIEGAVVDSQGNPIPGAAVWFDDPQAQITHTDDQGRYALSLDAAVANRSTKHAARVHAVAPGFASTDGPFSSHSKIELQAQRSIRFLILDQAGRPLRGVALAATVRKLGREFKDRPAPKLLAQTDTTGVAVLAPFDLGATYSLSAYLPGFQYYQGETAAFSFSSSPQRAVELELALGSTQVGWVESKAGSGGGAVEGVLVEARKQSSTDSTDPSVRMWRRVVKAELLAQALTDQDGKFELHDLPPGLVLLELNAPGFAPTRVEAVEVAAVDADLGSFVMEPGYDLVVRLVDEVRNPIPQTMVFLNGPTSREDWFQLDVSPTTDADGTVRFTDRQAGSYGLGVENPRFRSYYEGITLPLGNNEREPGGVGPGVLEQGAYVVELFRGRSIPIRVLDEEGLPMTGAVSYSLVTAVDQDGMRKQASGRGILDRGEAVLSGFSEGTIKFEVHGGSYPPLAEFVVALDAYGNLEPSTKGARVDGDVLELNLLRELVGGGSLEGSVVDSDGFPVAAGRVRFGQTVGAVEGGRYKLQRVRRGTGVLAVSAQGYPTYRKEVASDGSSTQVHDVRLEAGWTVSGTVWNTSGVPVSAAEVVTELTAGDSRSMGDAIRALTNEDGAFRLSSLATGTYRFGVAKQGFAPTEGADTVLVDADVAGVDLELLDSSEIFGRVMGVPEEAFPSIRVRSAQGGEEVRLSDDGRYRLIDLVAGVHVLRLSGEGVSTDGRTLVRRRSVEVAAGASVEFDFVVGEGVLTGTVRRDGVPVAQAFVSVRVAEGNVMGTGRTDQDGGFEIANLDPGELTVSVVIGSTTAYQERLSFYVDQDILIDLEVTELSGQVTDRQGSPISRAYVRLNPEQSGDRTRSAFGVTNEEGVYSLILPLDVDRNSSYHVSALAKGFGGVTKNWSSGDDAVLNFELSEGENVTVRWQDINPKNVTFSLVDSNRRVVYSRNLSAGFWEANDVPVGVWQYIIGSSLTQVVGTVEVVEGAGTTELDVSWPLTSNGRVVLPSELDGVLSQGTLRFRLRDGSGQAVLYPVVGSLQDSQPIYTRSRDFDLPLGSWTIELLKGNEIVHRAELEVYGSGQFEVRWERGEPLSEGGSH